MLAVRRADVAELNDIARAKLLAAGRLGPDAVNTGHAERGTEYRTGDAVIVTANNYRLGLLNGTPGRVTAVDPHEAALPLLTDGRESVVVPSAGPRDTSATDTPSTATRLRAPPSILLCSTAPEVSPVSLATSRDPPGGPRSTSTSQEPTTADPSGAAVATSTGLLLGSPRDAPKHSRPANYPARGRPLALPPRT